jgi:hypothetical protein
MPSGMGGTSPRAASPSTSSIICWTFIATPKTDKASMGTTTSHTRSMVRTPPRRLLTMRPPRNATASQTKSTAGYLRGFARSR